MHPHIDSASLRSGWATPVCPAAGRAARRRPYPIPAHETHAVLSLAAQAPHVRTARLFTEDVLTRWSLCPEDRAAAVLIVSELATNAAVHGGANLTLHLTHSTKRLLIQVMDTDNEDCHHEGAPVDPDEHGRGIDIVKALGHSSAIDRWRWGWLVSSALDIAEPG
ncbi:hypothetical protein KNE206_73600 [Kitasatospora sp. NE20-6]|uniref:ATP-binding protein n=1 Tax=Kitasatospora sp. NE20-6 TaxID=2859066 RepID=UPI0034DB8C5B